MMTDKAEPEIKWKCGIVRPIAEMLPYKAQHWAEVHDIVATTLGKVGFETRLVSDADSIGVIQGRIVKNLWESDLIVCDVSGKNPNVMFELGLRLAFDKPTIIIKDDVTGYSFDTSPIEHIGYPADLRYSGMIDFMNSLATKALATVQETEAPGYLSHFAPVRVQPLEAKSISSEEFIIEQLAELRSLILKNESRLSYGSEAILKDRKNSALLSVSGLTSAQVQKIQRMIEDKTGLASNVHMANGHPSVSVPVNAKVTRNEYREFVEAIRGFIAGMLVDNISADNTKS